MNFVVCVPVSYILNKSSVEAIQSLTFSELETKTAFAFDQTVKAIYLDMQSEKQNVTWRLLKSKVLFFNMQNSLSRCFQVKEINIEQPRYEGFLSSSRLVVSFSHDHYSLYQLVQNETFNSRSSRFIGLRKFRIISKYLNRTKNQCEVRSESQANAIDRCVHEASIEQNLNISYNFVIDKDRFSQHQWDTLFPGPVARHHQIEAKCREEFRIKDCSFSNYQNLLHEALTTVPDKRMAIIDPIIHVFFRSDEIPTFYSFLLDLLNIAAICST